LHLLRSYDDRSFIIQSSSTFKKKELTLLFAGQTFARKKNLTSFYLFWSKRIELDQLSNLILLKDQLLRGSKQISQNKNKSWSNFVHCLQRSAAAAMTYVPGHGIPFARALDYGK
jgi:hypothetical protein